ncbi:hypothetical protein CCH79_00014306, partial [Gambusia affinis]
NGSDKRFGNESVVRRPISRDLSRPADPTRSPHEASDTIKRLLDNQNARSLTFRICFDFTVFTVGRSDWCLVLPKSDFADISNCSEIIWKEFMARGSEINMTGVNSDRTGHAAATAQSRSRRRTCLSPRPRRGQIFSTSMRGLCKEEDYAFLGVSGSSTRGSPEDQGALEENWKDTKEARARRRLEGEQQEKERLRAIEDSKKEREQQWRRHIAEVTSSQEKTLQDRRTRLHSFREFQRKVLAEEGGAEGAAVHLLVTRMNLRDEASTTCSPSAKRPTKSMHSSDTTAWKEVNGTTVSHIGIFPFHQYLEWDGKNQPAAVISGHDRRPVMTSPPHYRVTHTRTQTIQLAALHLALGPPPSPAVGPEGRVLYLPRTGKAWAAVVDWLLGLTKRLWMSWNFSFSSCRNRSTRSFFSRLSCSTMVLGTSGITQATMRLRNITRFWEGEGSM